MKRNEYMSKAIVISLVMFMLALPGCTSGKKTDQAKKDKDESIESKLKNPDRPDTNGKDVIVVTPIPSETVKTEDSDKKTEPTSKEETEKPVKTETEKGEEKKESDKKETEKKESEKKADANEQAPSGETGKSDLYAKAQPYIDASIAFYNHLYGNDMKLVAFDSEIEETKEGFKFVLRSQAYEDQANVFIAEVKADTKSETMYGENGFSWKIGDKYDEPSSAEES
ncbi:MAG: hypothetical protein J6T40_06125 [Clostridiales bacterium]|nr:hypothetical protein [Clostridiales bacterium]MBR5937961.1 hypothetical protein [Clostridiales bacterium]